MLEKGLGGKKTGKRKPDGQPNFCIVLFDVSIENTQQGK